MQEVTTTNFAEFGHRERELATELLNAWSNQGLPEDFDNEAVVIMMNKLSGYVFLTNSDYQVAMMNGEALESFYTDFETGEEGFFDELSEESRARLNINQ